MAYRWFNNLGMPLRDTDGSILRWFNLQIDIDDRKRAEEALRASESNLRRTLDSISALVCTMNQAGEIEHLNQPMLDFFGKTTDHLKDWAVRDAVHPDDLPEALAAFATSLADGNPYDIEHRCRRADGVYRWFHVRANPLRDQSGKIIKWYGTNIDIDDRKLAEDAVRARERDLISIINTIPIFAWSTRPDGYCDFLSQRWLDYAGFTAEQAIGWAWGCHSSGRCGAPG
jgi:PAS domain S-box-containing protein